MKFTPEQKEWLALYERETGFDVLFPEDGMTFEAIAKFNVDWYESHAGGVHLRVSRFPKSEAYWNDFLNDMERSEK